MCEIPVMVGWLCCPKEVAVPRIRQAVAPMLRKTCLVKLMLMEFTRWWFVSILVMSGGKTFILRTLTLRDISEYPVRNESPYAGAIFTRRLYTDPLFAFMLVPMPGAMHDNRKNEWTR